MLFRLGDNLGLTSQIAADTMNKIQGGFDQPSGLGEEGHSIQLVHACLVNSQNYAPRCRGHLNTLSPETAKQRVIMH